MRANSRGIALPLILITIAVLGVIVLGAIAATRGPMAIMAQIQKQGARLMAAESELERTRALENGDSCIVTASADGLTEIWSVTAPGRFIVYADSEVIGITGDSIHIGGDGCDTDLIDTSLYLPSITRSITTDRLDGVTIRGEVLEIISESGVILSDIEIDGGMLIVQGDAMLVGKFKGKAKDGLPLLIVNGSLSSAVHDDEWEWEGVIGVKKDALLAGPIKYEGTVVARSVTVIGTITAEPFQTAPLGFTPQIRTIGRAEKFE